MMLAGTILGWRWPLGWFPPVTIGDEVSALLALGTLSLAFAALVQAMSALRTEAQADARDRRRYSPNPVVEILVDPAKPDLPVPIGPIVAVRVLGPGTAKDVRVSFYGYPASKKGIDMAGNLGVPSTTLLGSARPFLEPVAQSVWILLSEPWSGYFASALSNNFLSFDLDAILEVSARDLMDEPIPLRRYLLERREVIWSLLRPDEKRWVWSVRASPPEDVQTIESARAGFESVS
jgi:hypothetical protein